ncbi:hypothetical protein TcCL_ESM09826 [Trypanosoma cruzi]|nr:hypothetical protein TcCL_ESM09826 [Trypanosoma cruzi]
MEEANNHFSARASNTAVADGLLAQRESALAGRERHLEATLAQPQERMARIGALEARLAAWGADTPGRRGVPSSRRGPPDAPAHGSEDGATTPPHHERLMAGGAAAPTIPQPIFTGERRRVNSHTSLANLGRPRFPHPVTSPSRSPASEEASGSDEEDLGFLEFGFTTCSREVGMEASLESYSKSGALAITGTEGRLTPKLPLTFWFRGCAHCSCIGSPTSSLWNWAGLYRGSFGCRS